MEEENTKGLQDYIQILKRYKKQMLWIAASVFTIIVIVAFNLPAMYKATATILIEEQEIPEELVASTITSQADRRIQVISQRVMSNENLKNIIEKYNLYASDRKKQTIESVLTKLRENIQLDMINSEAGSTPNKPTQAIAFTLTFTNENAKVTQEVANELVSLYLNENLKRRNLEASETTDFLTSETKKLYDQIVQLETALAIFKEKNSGSLPELQQLNIQLLDRLEQQVNDFDKQINAATERKFYLESQLVLIEPNTSTFSATGERIFGSSDRLKSLQAEYTGLTARYGSTHPDVVKMRKEISALENEVGGVDKSEIDLQIKAKTAELVELSERYSSDHPDIKKLKQTIAHLEFERDTVQSTRKPIIKQNKTPDNPAYIQLQAQLQAANADINAIRTSKAGLTAKLNELESNLRAAPQVERQYHDLVRDYDTATAKYKEITAKQLAANMSQAMEKDRKGEKFSLIEPPMLPEEPFKPNRKAIVFLGFVLAVGSAFGIALLRAGLDSSIYGSKELQSITGAPPLAVISYIENDQDVLDRNKFRKKMIWSIAIGITLIIFLINMFYISLDVLWYVVLRKLGYANL